MFQKSRLRASNSLDVLAFFSSIFHEENLATKNNRERINGSNDGDSVSRTKILFLIDFFFMILLLRLISTILSLSLLRIETRINNIRQKFFGAETERNIDRMHESGEYHLFRSNVAIFR